MRQLHSESPICFSEAPGLKGRCANNMVVQENGVLVRLTEGRIVYADLYRCPRCGGRQAQGFAKSFVDEGLDLDFEETAALMAGERCVSGEGSNRGKVHS